MKIVWEFGKFYDNKAQPPSAQCHWRWCGWWEASLFAEPLDRLAALQNCRDELATRKEIPDLGWGDRWDDQARDRVSMCIAS